MCHRFSISNSNGNRIAWFPYLQHRKIPNRRWKEFIEFVLSIRRMKWIPRNYPLSSSSLTIWTTLLYVCTFGISFVDANTIGSYILSFQCLGFSVHVSDSLDVPYSYPVPFLLASQIPTNTFRWSRNGSFSLAVCVCLCDAMECMHIRTQFNKSMHVTYPFSYRTEPHAHLYSADRNFRNTWC